MDLQMILTSTVVATLITILASLYNSKRTENLKYITEERQKWREEIRKIAEDIEECPRNQIKKQLTRLKVRINANGKIALLNNDLSYFEDGHIWYLIEKLEDPCLDFTKYEEEKGNLINTLSLLLKFDWERQKRDVLGSNIKKIHVVLYVCVLLITVYVYGIPKELSKEGISPLYLVNLFCVSIPSLIFLIDEMLLKFIKRKRTILFTIVTTVVYFFEVLAVLYAVANISGVLLAGNINAILKILAAIMIVFYFLDVILSGVYIIQPIYKMWKYEHDAEAISKIRHEDGKIVVIS